MPTKTESEPKIRNTLELKAKKKKREQKNVSIVVEHSGKNTS